MKDFETLVGVYTHTHTCSLINRLNIKIKIDRDIKLVLEM